jgi:hypothetical protein
MEPRGATTHGINRSAQAAMTIAMVMVMVMLVHRIGMAAI